MELSKGADLSNLTFALVAVDEQRLVDAAIERGYVTFEDIKAIYPEGDQYLDAMDALSVKLVEAGVMLLPAASVQPLVAEAEAARRRKVVAHASAQRPGQLDLSDLYLAEIRQFSILTRSQEQWLGIAMECPKRTIDNPELQCEAATHRNWRLFFERLLGLASRQSAGIGTALLQAGWSAQRIIDELTELIRETEAWQVLDEPKNATALARLVGACPERILKSLFDLCTYLYALPEPALGSLECSIPRKDMVQIGAAIGDCSADVLNEAAARIEQRATLAGQTMVLHNLRLATSIAWRYRNQGLSDLDLYQEGAVGLLKAVEGFDYRQGNKFSTYAVWLIQQSIVRALGEYGSAIRLPAHAADALYRIHYAQAQLEEEQGREPTIAEVAKRCKMPEKKVERVLGWEPKLCSLDSLLCCSNFALEWRGPDEGFVQLRHCPTREYAERHYWQMDGVQDDDFTYPPCVLEQMSPQDLAAREGVDYSTLMLSTLGSSIEPRCAAAEQQLREALDQVLHTLSPRESRVIQRRFGLRDGREWTLEELGQSFGLTRERIRQIQARALGKLQHPRRTRRLRHFLEM